MDTEKIRRLNELWMPIYPFLVKWVKQYCPASVELTLELGPFSGGISAGLKREFPELKGFFLTPQERIVLLLREHFGKGLEGIVAPLDRLPTKQVFDLVLFRGAFFFLNQAILKEVYAALNRRGRAVLGGGYGPLTPAREIEKIADESRRLNMELGKKRVSKAFLWRMVESAGISEKSRIVEEGGLWLVISKQSEAGGRQ